MNVPIIVIQSGLGYKFLLLNPAYRWIDKLEPQKMAPSVTPKGPLFFILIFELLRRWP